MTVNTRTTQIEAAEQSLERLLAEHAEAGLPELVLVKLLRDYAITIETIGYVPRTWRQIGHTEDQFPTRERP